MGQFLAKLCKNVCEEVRTFQKVSIKASLKHNAQLTFTCSKLTIKTLEKSVKYIQS